MTRRLSGVAARRLAGALAVAAMLPWAGCATNPVTGKRQISLVSRAKELEIGREADPAIIAEYGLYGDSTLQRYVDSVGQRLAASSQLPGLTWHFRLLDSPVVNAFALPGGYIYITRGILAYMNSESQLAGVLGHEIGHVTARHSAEQITRSEIASLGLIVGTLFVDAFRPYSAVAQQGLGLLFLKYSRDNESQADELGIGYAVKAGWDPREIPGTYAMLKRVAERRGDNLPSFLSTHPDPGDRQIRTTQLSQAAYAGAHRELRVGTPEYHRRIEGLVFGDDPRGGFFIHNRFYQPDLGIEMIFPDGWHTLNQPSAVTASNQSLGGSMELSLQFAKDSTATPERFVQSLKEEGKIQDAVGRNETFRDYLAWVGSIVGDVNGSRHELIAGFVRYRPGQFLQVLGQGPSGRAGDQVYDSIRSIAAMRDSSLLNVTSDRVRFVTAERGGDFGIVVGSLGPQAASVEDTAILNNLRATAAVSAGTAIKIVQKGLHP